MHTLTNQNVFHTFKAASVAVTLNAMTGTFTLAENAALNDVAGTLSGKTSGSTLSLFDDAGGRVALSGSNIVRGATALDFESATSHSFTVRETLAGATNTPRDTVLSLTVTNVFEQPALSALALDATEPTVDQAVTINITGATAGSTITVQTGTLPTGLTLNSAARTISGTPTVVANNSFTLRETLADSSNSPRDTALNIDVQQDPITAFLSTISASSNSGFFECSTATGTDATYDLPDDNGGNSFTSGTNLGPSTSASGATFGDQSTQITRTVTAGNKSIILRLTKAAASGDSGTTFLFNNNGIYADGSGSSTSGTIEVDGVSKTTRDALHAALDDGSAHTLMISGFDPGTIIYIGRNGSSFEGDILAIAIVDETDAGGSLSTWQTEAKAAVEAV